MDADRAEDAGGDNDGHDKAVPRQAKELGRVWERSRAGRHTVVVGSHTLPPAPPPAWVLRVRCDALAAAGALEVPAVPSRTASARGCTPGPGMPRSHRASASACGARCPRPRSTRSSSTRATDSPMRRRGAPSSPSKPSMRRRGTRRNAGADAPASGLVTVAIAPR